MTTQRAEQIIVISLVVMLASTVGGSLAGNKAKGDTKAKEKYYGRKIVGGFLAMLFASLLAEVAPAPGAYLSVGMSSYAFIHYGVPAITKEKQKEKQPNLKNSRERLPFSLGPEIAPEPLGEITI
jgi:hypothetical protein